MKNCCICYSTVSGVISQLENNLKFYLYVLTYAGHYFVEFAQFAAGLYCTYIYSLHTSFIFKIIVKFKNAIYSFKRNFNNSCSNSLVGYLFVTLFYIQNLFRVLIKKRYVPCTSYYIIKKLLIHFSNVYEIKYV